MTGDDSAGGQPQQPSLIPRLRSTVDSKSRRPYDFLLAAAAHSAATNAAASISPPGPSAWPVMPGEMGLYPAYPILPPPMSLAHTAYPLVPLPFPSHSKMAISPPRVATAELPEPIEVILHRSAPAGGDGVRIALLHPLLDLTAAAPPDFSAATLLRGRRLQVEHTGVKSCCAPTTAAAATGVTRSWEKEKKELGVSKGAVQGVQSNITPFTGLLVRIEPDAFSLSAGGGVASLGREVVALKAIDAGGSDPSAPYFPSSAAASLNYKREMDMLLVPTPPAAAPADRHLCKMLLGSCLAAAASPSSTTTATSIIPFHESLLSLLHAPQDPQQPLALLLVGPKGHLLTHPDDQQQQEEEEEADALDERFGREYAAYLRRERPVPFDMAKVCRDGADCPVRLAHNVYEFQQAGKARDGKRHSLATAFDIHGHDDEEEKEETGGEAPRPCPYTHPDEDGWLPPALVRCENRTGFCEEFKAGTCVFHHDTPHSTRLSLAALRQEGVLTLMDERRPTAPPAPANPSSSPRRRSSSHSPSPERWWRRQSLSRSANKDKSRSRGKQTEGEKRSRRSRSRSKQMEGEKRERMLREAREWVLQTWPRLSEAELREVGGGRFWNRFLSRGESIPSHMVDVCLFGSGCWSRRRTSSKAQCDRLHPDDPGFVPKRLLDCPNGLRCTHLLNRRRPCFFNHDKDLGLNTIWSREAMLKTGQWGRSPE